MLEQARASEHYADKEPAVTKQDPQNPACLGFGGPAY
jgi:hypothetical protein